MRIISGEKKGLKLLTLEGDAVRPTTDRVKESLFSIIQFSLAGSNILDLFAGSGQIGIEALSRNAKFVTFVDSSLKSLNVCKSNLQASGYQEKAKLVNSKAEAFLSSTNELFDIAFLDPPYNLGLLEEVLPILVPCMSNTGTIICEHPSNLVLDENYGDFHKTKNYRYGKIMLTVYKKEHSL